MTRLMIAGCVVASVTLLAGAAEAQRASADMKDATGNAVGEAILEQRDGHVEITATFNGLPPGTRALHIHEVGRCDPPFDSAGAHFNPAGKQHGKDNPRGSHAGDLPNLEVPDTGRVKLEMTVKGVSVAGGPQPLLDADGSALVIHEAADDYASDPAGNAGKRLACGIITR